LVRRITPRQEKRNFMASGKYDIITVGGGLGGSSLATAMAKHGARVLVLEREKQFKDRVRGEQMHPWGVAEAKALVIYDLLGATCGHELPWWDVYTGDMQTGHRNLLDTTPQHAPEFSFFHPDMQEVLLQAAADAGAEVRRGAAVRNVKRGETPSVVFEQAGQVDEIAARLVIGADGRTSLVRKWAGFAVQRDPDRRLISGVLFDDMPTPEDTSYIVTNPSLGQAVPLFPQGAGRVRVYLIHQKHTSRRFQGEADLPHFIAEAIRTGAPAAFFTSARAVGPLATFEGADTWVEHPYRDGIVLIGDAAASNDPSFGSGLSLTVRDARVLRDALLRHEDWNVAGHAYAEEHDRYYSILHTVTQWVGQLIYDPGPEADACRARAVPLLGQDATRMPDHLFSGPDHPVDETTRRRLFGEE
jgi:2-polyprenyl-6-methoxyphenol hydroxylase-like FAD-dependent oxidoreductase